jgi:DNA helicase-2/ATP-dependent DNA helicase PcrA
MLSERGMTSVTDIRRLAGRLSGRDVPKLMEYADSIDSVAAACRESTSTVVRAVRFDIGLGETMDVLDSGRREADRSTHADDLLALESLAALHPDPATFESWLRSALAQPPPQGPAVHLSTIHKIKGREWEHVIVFGASKGLLPHRLSDDEEGERRVFHVALTRAIRQVLVLADSHDPSPFVAELNGSRAHAPLQRLERASSPSSGIGGVRDRSQTSARGRRAASARKTPTAPALAAAVGLVLEHGGHTGTVVDVTDAAAVILVGSARLKVPFGSEVRVEGSTMMLAAAGASAGDTEKYVTALRTWRSDAAKQASVPAYVVLNDSELTGIAATRPTTLAELARCKGVGPVRLERWGDELLAALNGAEDD